MYSNDKLFHLKDIFYIRKAFRKTVTCLIWYDMIYKLCISVFNKALVDFAWRKLSNLTYYVMKGISNIRKKYRFWYRNSALDNFWYFFKNSFDLKILIMNISLFNIKCKVARDNLLCGHLWRLHQCFSCNVHHLTMLKSFMTCCVFWPM